MRDAIDRQWDERTVTVKRVELLSKLKENLKKHIAEYNEAVIGYKEQAMLRLSALSMKITASLDENFAAIKAKIESFDPNADEPLGDNITLVNVTSFNLQVPRSYAKSYEIAIAMAEWEVNDTIEIKQSQFQCFILDDWDWKTNFQTLNKTYRK